MTIMLIGNSPEGHFEETDTKKLDSKPVTSSISIS